MAAVVRDDDEAARDAVAGSETRIVAARRLHPDSGTLGILEDLGPIVGEELAQLIGNLELSEGFWLRGVLRGAGISMSAPDEPAELRISVIFEARLARSLANVLLSGDTRSSAAARRDMLREIANLAGGAVARAAAAERVLVTSGLPADDDDGDTRTGMTRCWTARVAGSDMQLAILGEVLERAIVRLPLAALREGMVLSREVRDRTGAVLVDAGTRITAAERSRILAALGPGHEVEVASPRA